MITLFGATGYTGELIAHALDREKLPFRIAGRSAEKLNALSSSLVSKPSCLVVDLSRNPAYDHLTRDTQVLINCVGPFTDLGERVLRQAALSGVHYLDPSNELGYVLRMQSYHRMAENSKSIVIPACGFEVALSDCAANLLNEDPSTVFDEIHVIYQMTGTTPSLGTRRSALRSLATSWVSYQNGQWKGVAPVSRKRTFHSNGKPIHALSIPSCESVTFPAHIKVKTISVWMSVNRIQALVGPVLIPYYARFLRSIAGPLLQKWIAFGAPDPRKNASQIAPFWIQVVARLGNENKIAQVQGTHPYHLTAEILTTAARRLLREPPSMYGVLPPSRLLGDQFLEYAKSWDIETRVL